jgi:hypothetical protein
MGSRTGGLEADRAGRVIVAMHKQKKKKSENSQKSESTFHMMSYGPMP